jgi:hypothetical protein
MNNCLTFLLATFTATTLLASSEPMENTPSNFGEDIAFLKKHTDAIVLRRGDAAVAVAPRRSTTTQQRPTPRALTPLTAVPTMTPSRARPRSRPSAAAAAVAVVAVAVALMTLRQVRAETMTSPPKVTPNPIPTMTPKAASAVAVAVAVEPTVTSSRHPMTRRTPWSRCVSRGARAAEVPTTTTRSAMCADPRALRPRSSVVAKAARQVADARRS